MFIYLYKLNYFLLTFVFVRVLLYLGFNLTSFTFIDYPQPIIEFLTLVVITSYRFWFVHYGNLCKQMFNVNNATSNLRLIWSLQ